jgi:hypothetical protein
MAGYKSKKKAAEDKLQMPGTIGGAKVVFPKVTKGSHLTVTEYEDGRTELVWDHDALQRDVESAIASVSTK